MDSVLIVFIILLSCFTLFAIVSIVCDTIINIKKAQDDNFWNNFEAFHKALKEDIEEIEKGED